MIRRAVLMTVALFVILAQMVSGIAGPDAQVCLCSTCVTIEHPGEGCGPGSTDGSPSGLVVIGNAACTDCYLIPLPSTAYSPASSAPTHPTAADIPATRTMLGLVSWPSPRTTRPQRHDRLRIQPGLHLGHLRTVVLTC